MPPFAYPGAYVPEVPFGVRTIAGVSTSTPAFVDPPGDGDSSTALVRALAESGSANAALFHPAIQVEDPPRSGALRMCAPSGAVAGLYAHTDVVHGVWTAAAGTEAVLPGAAGPAVELSRGELEALNAAGVNCIRTFPHAGTVVWGARTIRASVAPEWTYVPVRRLALFLEASIDRGVHWAVFEPNDEPLWAKLRAQVGLFLHGLFRAGAFQGATPTRRTSSSAVSTR